MGPKLGPKSHPKRLRKPCRKRGPQKHPTRPEHGANMGPTWPPQGHQIRPKFGQNASRCLIRTPSYWKHAILASPGPILEPLGAFMGPICGVASSPIRGPFGGSHGSLPETRNRPQKHNASPINNGTAPQTPPPSQGPPPCTARTSGVTGPRFFFKGGTASELSKLSPSSKKTQIPKQKHCPPRPSPPRPQEACAAVRLLSCGAAPRAAFLP